MAYIGRDIRTGAFRQLDDISSGFDGSDTTHTMQVNSTNVSVGDVNQILLSLGGVIQKPGTDFTVSGSTLTFTTAPAANTSFFAILLGSDNGGTVTPTDGSVTGDKIASDLSIATNVTITTADNTDTLTLKSTDADANVGPVLNFNRDSSSPADNDFLGAIDFQADDDAGNTHDYIRILARALDVSNGSEKADLIIKDAGGNNIVNFAHSEIAFNDDSQDRDFRVESNGNTHMLLVDAGADCVSIGQVNDIGAMVNITSDTSNLAEIAMGSTIGGTGSAAGGHLKLFLGAQSNSGGGNADTQAGDTLGRISFNGQGTDYSYQGGEIELEVQTGDGEDNRAAQGTAMVFKTMNVGSTGYSENFRIAQDGTLTATDTTIGSNSDERLKENIQDYTYDIAKFKQFKAKTFDWKNPIEHNSKSNNRGFIAQEILAIDDYWIDQIDISKRCKNLKDEGDGTEEVPAGDLSLIPAESDGSHLAYTSKLGKKDAMYISVIQQLITRIEALESA